MSHATVTIHVTSKRLVACGGDLDRAVADLMAPFEESPDEGSPFLVFSDQSAKIKNYVPSLDYPTLEDYARDYHGFSEHEGLWGYWGNPNAKWDWYVVGGRWAGRFGGSDVIKASEIDFAAAKTVQEDRARSFYRDYQKLLEGREWGFFEGPRDNALSLGLVRVVHGPVESASGPVRVMPWAKKLPATDERSTWNDVAEILTEEECVARFASYFSPLRSFASVDEDGWHEAGELGWFGCSSDTPETMKAWCDGFEAWLRKAEPDDLFVSVDYHI